MRRAFKHRWDADSGRWTAEKGVVGQTIDGLKSLLGLPVYPLRAPDGEDLQRFLKSRSEIAIDPRSSMVTVTFQHADPQFAQDILRAMHAEADGYLRRRVLVQTAEHIRYLENTLRSVTVAEQRSALAQVLSDQEKLMMRARAKGAFAADPFGSITVSSRPTRPSPVLGLIAGFLGGLLLGAVFVLVHSGLWKAFYRSSG
jgi:Fe2+ transport system protein B